MKVAWTEHACSRLVEIETFIARDDPAAASRFVDRLVARGEALATSPDRGRKLREMPNAGLRELLVGKYRIVYRVTANTLEILTVFEGHRLLREAELRPR
jgi:plasmid stabilization system protein ParE